MSTELKIQALKDRDKTFELGKFTAISKAQPVVVVDSHRAVMSFNAQGDFSEVMVRPLRTSMAALFHEQMFVGRHCDYYTLGELAQFQSRGGKL